jgi:hypothetical protein
MVPVTTLSLPFVLVGTLVAQLLGLDETTIGAVAAPAGLPGATAANTLPIPLPASKAATSNAISIDGLYEPLNLIIFFTSFVSRPSYPIYCAERVKGVGVARRVDGTLFCIK